MTFKEIIQSALIALSFGFLFLICGKIMTMFF